MGWLASAGCRAVACAAAFVLLWLAAAPAHAEPDAEAARAELRQTEAEINRLKRMLGNLRQEVSGLEKELRDSESQIGRLRREAGGIEQQIRDGEARLVDLQSQADALQQALEEQQEQTARQLRPAHRPAQQDYLKLLLNQEDLARIARRMRNSGDFNGPRGEETN